MIILREKLFRRDDFSSVEAEKLNDNPNLVKIYGPSKINIEISSKYEKDLSKLGPKGSPNRKVLDGLKEDIKNDWIISDGPHKGDTHYLGDFSKPGKFYTFSKEISNEHRLNYRVYPPKEYIKGGKKEYIKRVVLVSCYGHELENVDYLNDKDLRARKDRMRGNAPYRKPDPNKNKKKRWQR